MKKVLLPNHAPASCPQIEFVDSPTSWDLASFSGYNYHKNTVSVSLQDGLKMAVTVVSSWKGLIKMTDINEPGRPVWFLIGVGIKRFAKANYVPKTGDMPRIRQAWIATDGESWYRIGNPRLPHRKCGRTFIPCDVKLTNAAKNLMIQAVKIYSGAEEVAVINTSI